LTKLKFLWLHVEAESSHWCSAAAIQNWLISQNGYYLYDEQITPLLSPAQQKSHQTFPKRFCNNWGLSPGKYLLITMCDEKWFWGMVCQKGAKACKELGIDTQTMRAYHKSSMNKTVGTAVTGFAFEDNIENEGKAMKLGFHRVQSH
jgi:hypothetical protein